MYEALKEVYGSTYNFNTDLVKLKHLTDYYTDDKGIGGGQGNIWCNLIRSILKVKGFFPNS